MNVSKIALVLAVSAALLIGTSAQAQTTPITVSNVIGYAGGANAMNLVAAPGSPEYAYGSYWETGFGAGSGVATLTFNFGAVQDVRKIEIWNHLYNEGYGWLNARGTQTILVQFSLTNDFSAATEAGVNSFEFTDLVAAINGRPGSNFGGTPDVKEVQGTSLWEFVTPDWTYDFGQCIPAQYVRITIGDVFDGIGKTNLNEHGLCQVNFFTCDVPEPATMSLLALGGLALLRRKKR